MMSPQSPSCFISYCHDDADRESIDALRTLFGDELSNRGIIYYDQDISTGFSFRDFMSKINDVDGVIVLLTPYYKSKTLERSGGVFEEFKRIMQRYHELEYMRRDANSYRDDYVIYWPKIFQIFPLLFSGEMATSCPDELLDLKHKDFRRFRASRSSKDGTLFVSDAVRRMFLPQVREIIDLVRATRVQRSQDYRVTYSDLHARLFRDLKAEYRSLSSQDDIEVDNYLFVKTHAFKRVRNGGAYILVGRKGSGKSTVVYYLPRIDNDNYTGQIQIVADKFGLQKIFFELEYYQIRSELRGIATYQQLFYMTWGLFVLICTADAIVSCVNHGRTPTYPKFLCDKLVGFLDPLKFGGLRERKLDQEAVFVFCLQKAIKFLETCIKNARPEDEYFLADIVGRFRAKYFLREVVSSDVNAAFEQASRSKMRFLLSLDGFDTAFQDFRRDQRRLSSAASRLISRPMVEIDWLRAFVRLVVEIKQRKRKEAVFELLSPCVTIPKDRFIEIRQSERDEHIYQGRYLELFWSGIELSILVRKRLEILYDFFTDKNLSAVSRIERIVTEKCSQLPAEIHGVVGRESFLMPTFLYILRHTFWRPREILFHYASLLTATNAGNRYSKLSVENIKRIVSETTFVIIEGEFLNEFKDTLRNLEYVLQRFDLSDQVMSYDEFVSRIGNVDFDFAGHERPIGDIDEKLSFLFEIGFFGVIPDELTRRRFNFLLNEVFSFTEGSVLIKTHGGKKFHGMQMVIHPIFCEYLRLRTQSGHFTLKYTWDFLIEHERLMFAIS